MPKVLIIEDDPILLASYKRKFAQASFTVCIADSGEGGLVVAAQERPDFILLDLIMPEMGGLAVLRELKGAAETARIPVAILTVLSEDSPRIKEECQLLSQAVGYYRKDLFTPAQIVDKVKEYLKLPPVPSAI